MYFNSDVKQEGGNYTFFSFCGKSLESALLPSLSSGKTVEGLSRKSFSSLSLLHHPWRRRRIFCLFPSLSPSVAVVSPLFRKIHFPLLSFPSFLPPCAEFSHTAGRERRGGGALREESIICIFSHTTAGSVCCLLPCVLFHCLEGKETLFSLRPKPSRLKTWKVFP